MPLSSHCDAVVWLKTAAESIYTTAIGRCYETGFVLFLEGRLLNISQQSPGDNRAIPADLKRKKIKMSKSETQPKMRPRWRGLTADFTQLRRERVNWRTVLKARVTMQHSDLKGGRGSHPHCISTSTNR